jgi:hypothetical protein
MDGCLHFPICQLPIVHGPWREKKAGYGTETVLALARGTRALRLDPLLAWMVNCFRGMVHAWERL